MPTPSEINQFKRLIGDFAVDAVDLLTVQSYLDDAAREKSANDPQTPPVATFDLLVPNAKAEAVYLAAINWWWDRAAKLAEKHTTTIGQASQGVGETFDRAMQMIQSLQTALATVEAANGGNSVLIDNISRFSKSTLSRLGGVEEEATDAKY